MELISISESQARDILTEQLQVSYPLTRSDYAEILRMSVLASPGQTEYHLKSQLQNQYVPLELEQEVIKDVLRELIFRGDINSLTGRKLYPTPLRLVKSAEDFVVIGSATRKQLRSCPLEVYEQDSARRILGSQSPELLQWLASVGGCLIDPATWSNLRRAPVADESYLESLGSTNALGTVLEPLEHFDLSSKKWHKSSDLGEGLWRQPASYGHDYLWNTGHGFYPISRDQANRAQYALCRNIAPLEAHYRQEQEMIVCQFLYFLPRAEYRHLCLHSVAQQKLDCVISTADWPLLKELFQSQLGIKFVEKTV